MSFREHPMLLRQNFTKLWPNNIFLHEAKAEGLSFLSVLQTQVLLETVLHHRYIKFLAVRTEDNEMDFDTYVNLYKYQKNERLKKRRRIRGRWNLIHRGSNQWRKERLLRRDRKDTSFLTERFLKTTIYQQLLHELIGVGTKLVTLLLRIREPIRRLGFLNAKHME
jgi:hypothetical protein